MVYLESNMLKLFDQLIKPTRIMMYIWNPDDVTDIIHNLYSWSIYPKTSKQRASILTDIANNFFTWRDVTIILLNRHNLDYGEYLYNFKKFFSKRRQTCWKLKICEDESEYDSVIQVLKKNMKTEVIILLGTVIEQNNFLRRIEINGSMIWAQNKVWLVHDFFYYGINVSLDYQINIETSRGFNYKNIIKKLHFVKFTYLFF